MKDGCLTLKRKFCEHKYHIMDIGNAKSNLQPWLFFYYSIFKDVSKTLRT